MRVRGLVVRKRRLKEDVIDCTSAIFSFRGWSPIVCIALSERRTVMSSNGVRRTSRFLSTASPRRIGTRRRSACSARSPSFACTQTQLSHRSCGTHLAARGRTASRANLAPRPRHDDVSRISICSGAQQRIWLATQPNCARSRPTCPYKAYWPVTNMTASRSSETAMTIVMTPSPRFFSPGGSLGIMTGFRRAGLSAEVLSEIRTKADEDFQGGPTLRVLYVSFLASFRVWPQAPSAPAHKPGFVSPTCLLFIRILTKGPHEGRIPRNHRPARKDEESPGTGPMIEGKSDSEKGSWL